MHVKKKQMWLSSD